MVAGVWEAFVGRQPSYPFLVLQSLTSVSPLLTLHSDWNLAPCSGLGESPNSCAHPTPCSSGLSMMRESLEVICLGSEGEKTVGVVMFFFVIDWGCALCTEVKPEIESWAVEICLESPLRRSVEGDKRTLHSLLISAERFGVILGSDSVSDDDDDDDDGKTRSKGTSCPSFLRSLSIFCLRRLLKGVML